MNRRTLVIAAFLVAVLAVVSGSSLYTVSQTEQVLLLQFGKPIRVVRQPGLHVKWPFVQNVVYFDKRLLDVEPPPEEVIGADQKRVVIDTYTRYRIINPLLFYQTVGTEDAARGRLMSLISSSMRQVIGNVPLTALLSVQRAAIMHHIRDEVLTAAKPFGVDVVDTRIRSANLPPQNSEAIYARMNSDRQKQAALYRAEGAQEAAVVRAKADRDRTVILADAQRQAQQLKGEGDASAISVYAKAYGQDPKFFAFYRSLEAYRRALAGRNTTFVLSPNSSFFKFFRSPQEAPPRAAQATSVRPSLAAALADPAPKVERGGSRAHGRR